MNQREFNVMHRDSRMLLDPSIPVKEGAIVWSRAESWQHYLSKCVIVRLLKAGIPPEQLNHIVGWDKNITKEEWEEISYKTEILEETTNIDQNFGWGRKFKKWQVPKIYTEAQLSSRFKIDVFIAASIDGRFAIEIADTETYESLEKKRRRYKLMGIEMIEVRI